MAHGAGDHADIPQGPPDGLAAAAGAVATPPAQVQDGAQALGPVPGAPQRGVESLGVARGLVPAGPPRARLAAEAVVPVAASLLGWDAALALAGASTPQTGYWAPDPRATANHPRHAATTSRPAEQASRRQRMGVDWASVQAVSQDSISWRIARIFFPQTTLYPHAVFSFRTPVARVQRRGISPIILHFHRLSRRLRASPQAGDRPAAPWPPDARLHAAPAPHLQSLPPPQCGL